MLTNESVIRINPTAPEAEGTLSTPLRLWLVDDNDRLRNTVAELLARSQGVECTRSFSSATAALSALASRTGPDVILLDIQMGDENGLDAVRPIKSLSRDTRVFMFTTLSDQLSRQRAMENGASGFLLKRCPIDEIVETIRKPGEFDGLPATRRRRTAPLETTTVNYPSGQRPQAADAKASCGNGRQDVIKRCLGVLRSFWN